MRNEKEWMVIEQEFLKQFCPINFGYRPALPCPIHLRSNVILAHAW